MTGQNRSFETILEEGKRLESNREYGEALRWYQLALTNSLTNHEQILILTETARMHYYAKEYLKSTSLYHQIIKKDSSNVLLIDNYLGLAYNHWRLKSRDSAIHYTQKASELNSRIPDSYPKVNSNYKIGFIYKSYDLNDTALPFLLNSYDGFRKYNKLKQLANVCNTIALIHRLQGNLSTSLTYYHKGKSIRKELNDIRGVSLAYNNLGNGHKALMQLDSALYYYEKSLQLKQRNNLKNQGFTLHNIGTVYYMKGNHDVAKSFYEKALKKKIEENDTRTQVYTYNELAFIAIEENALENASVYLDSSKNYSTGKTQLTLRWYELQKILFRKKEDFAKAFEFQNLYIDLYKELYRNEKSKVIIDNQEKFDTHKRIQKIEDLTEVNEETTKTLNTRTLYLIGTLALLVFVLVVYYITYQRQKLKSQKEDIKNLKALFSSQDMIRNKIGRDLHDIVKSKYEGIRLMIASLSRSNQLNEDILDINHEMVEANNQVRTLSHRLSPLDQRVQHSTLNQIIRAELNKFQLHSAIQVVITSKLPELWNRMKLESKSNLYGILLECINNIRDHSNATEVIVTPSIQDPISTLIISDNGTKKSPFKEGIGIGNMKSRARLMQGTLQIYTTHQNFQVVLEFPMKNNIEHEAQSTDH
jgi:signal transduction histidine kinase